MAKMTFQFLDVGQGDSTLVQVRPDGQDWDELVLIDCGEKRSPFKVAREDALRYLTNTIDENSRHRNPRGVPLVDTLFITHPDGDHYNMLNDLVAGPYPSFPGEELEFGRIYYGGEPGDYPRDFLKNLGGGNLPPPLGSRQQAQIDPHTRAVAPTWSYAGGRVNVYLLSVNYPSRNGKEPNPKSIVLLFDLNGQKVVLQGDAEKDVETHIRKAFDDAEPGFLKARAMKLGHHGGRQATSAAWVNQLEPRAVFATGDMYWAHPYCEPICRVREHLFPPLDRPGFPVWYCCGRGGVKNREYFNNPTDRAICLNLWYMVANDTEEIEEEEDGMWNPPVDVAKGMVYGVQWELEVTEAGVNFGVTERARPAAGQMVAPGFDCLAGPSEVTVDLSLLEAS